MSDNIAFGIGCFNFGIKKPPSFTLKGQDYVSELQRALESIPNIDNIKIDADDEFIELEIEVKEPFSEIGYGTNLFPPTSFPLDIDFDIYIPTRLQIELWPDRHCPKISAERFGIQIRNTYYLPVTFVETINSTEDQDPSTSVVIVREFLKKHFTDSKLDFIRFEYLGPSPFWGDFFLSSSDNKCNEADYNPEGFVVQFIPHKGYASLEIAFDPALYTDFLAAKEALYYELKDEAGFYYWMSHLRAMQMNEWVDLEKRVDDLLETYKAKGIKRLFNIFRVYMHIHNAVIALTEFESSQIWNKYTLKSDYQNLLKDGKIPYIDSYLKDMFDEFHTYPTDQVREVISLLEGRRSKSIENLLIILAAFVGGIAGSIFTLLVTSG